VTARSDDELDAANESFHEAYARARGRAEDEVPVFLILPDTLVLFRRAERREARYTSRAFHLLKAAAHAPIGLYALLCKPTTQPKDARVLALRARLHAALTTHRNEHALALSDEPEALSDLRAALEHTLHFIDALDGPVPAQALRVFASEMGTLLQSLIDHATRIELATLHACVEELVATLSPDERRALHVVVTGDHQARARNLGMQYFQARLGEAAEAQLVYAEGITEEAEALALVGSRRLDAVLARAFFGDPKRLQRDVLGDAVRDRLRVVKLPSLF